jgi:hydrogenase maturation protease
MTNLEAVVIGMGNEFRADDAAGLMVARKIREYQLSNVRVVDGVSEGSALMDAWKEAHIAIVVDSVVSGARPGHIYRFDALKETIPENYFIGYSTHAFNISQTVRLARTLGELPACLIVYGIEGTNFSPGITSSPEVDEAVAGLTEKIINEIKSKCAV